MIKACAGDGQLHNLLVIWFWAKKWLFLDKIWSFEFKSPIFLHLGHWGLIVWIIKLVVWSGTDHIRTLELNFIFGKEFYILCCQLVLKGFEDTYHEANSCKEQKFWAEDDQEISVSKDQQLGEERSSKCWFPDIDTSWIQRIKQWATCTSCELHLLRLLISFLKELTDKCQYLSIDCLTFSQQKGDAGNLKAFTEEQEGI